VTAAAARDVWKGGAPAGLAAGVDTVRAAVYCRISDDRRGLGLGVARQRQDCTELARRNGWQVAGTFIDNDVSAYSGKPRLCNTPS
jgi:site-specific DNA recombinase